MPIYEYECRKCKAHTEVFQKITDKPPVKCRKCGGRLEKLISAVAIQFKGSGWYVTDYAENRKKPESGEEKKAEKPETSAKDSKSKSKEDSPKKSSETTSSTKVPSGD
jgi:putative FmdB family regulatory protein